MVQNQAMVPENLPIELLLTARDINIVLAGLGELQQKVSNPIVQNITAQANRKVAEWQMAQAKMTEKVNAPTDNSADTSVSGVVDAAGTTGDQPAEPAGVAEAETRPE